MRDYCRDQYGLLDAIIVGVVFNANWQAKEEQQHISCEGGKRCTHPAISVVHQERNVRYEKGHVSVLSHEGHGRDLRAVFLAHTRARCERN